MTERKAAGREMSSQRTTLICGSATELDFRDVSFDIVSQITVFSSILDRSTRKKLADEMLRVVEPLGSVIWLDSFVSNPRNPDIRGIAKSEIGELFPSTEISLKRVLLARPIVRTIPLFADAVLSIGPSAAALYALPGSDSKVSGAGNSR